MKARIRSVRDKLLSLPRILGKTLETYNRPALNAYLHGAFFAYMIVIVVVIGMFFIIADNQAKMFPDEQRTHTFVQIKYAILAVYPLSGVALGIVFRWYELNKRHKSVWKKHWRDIAKVGILMGGLASAKLAGVIAIIREIARDADTIASGWVLLMAMIPILVIALVTYITARDSIVKR